jgi:hypothetical protein
VETTLPWQPAAPPSRLASTAPLPSNVHAPGVQSEPGAPPAPRVDSFDLGGARSVCCG